MCARNRSSTNSMTASTIAILVSCLSLLISGISLGWNIYKDVYLRARVRTSFALMIIQHPTSLKSLWRFSFFATNLGPGKVRLEVLILLEWSIWKKITRSCRYESLRLDFKHPLGGTLPRDLDVGEQMALTFDPDDCKFLSEKHTHTDIGIRDSFGRFHWCNKKDMVEAKKDFREKKWAKTE